MNQIWIWISGGFILGLLSAGHCLGMCGPLAIFLGTRFGDQNASLGRRIFFQVLLSAGKTFTYALIGLIFGFAGSLLATWSRWMKLSHTLPVIFSVLLIILGLSFFGFLPKIEMQFKKSEGWLFSLFRSHMPSHKSQAAFLTGMVWGLLPCPMVLVPALSAAVSGGFGGVEGALRGFFMMLAFGAGTFPAILSSAVVGTMIKFDIRRWSGILAGCFLIVLGIITFLISVRH
ncbi:MAG: sulfite exporter TauE/SafE family protein [Candidatus Omnitrophica bacterium]|nr:sulfite exporter TauE/SafE family protein [Candidatus Omnitrophota bacterium]